MIISLNGTPGSGKSTIAEKLAEKLNWPRYYMGGMRREAAQKRGLTLAEYNKLGETDAQTDQEVDFFQRDLGKKDDNFVVEGRTSWYFIPQSLKIYLDVDPKEGARRIFGSLKKKNTRNEDTGLNSWEDVFESNKRRIESDNKRYRQYYDIDVYDLKNFDYYLDTTNLTPSQVFQSVYDYVKNNLDKRKI